jgi:hypothetical protein
MALQRWERKIANVVVTPQAIWPIEKPFMKRDRTRGPTAIYGS